MSGLLAGRTHLWGVSDRVIPVAGGKARPRPVCGVGGWAGGARSLEALLQEGSLSTLPACPDGAPTGAGLPQEIARGPALGGLRGGKKGDGEGENHVTGPERTQRAHSCLLPALLTCTAGLCPKPSGGAPPGYQGPALQLLPQPSGSC